MLSYLDRYSRSWDWFNTKGEWFNPKTNRVNLRVSILSFCISQSQRKRRTSRSDSLILTWREAFWISAQRQIGLNRFCTRMSHRRFCSLGPVPNQLLREEESFVALADTSYTTLTLVVSASTR